MDWVTNGASSPPLKPFRMMPVAVMDTSHRLTVPTALMLATRVVVLGRLPIFMNHMTAQPPLNGGWRKARPTMLLVAVSNVTAVLAPGMSLLPAGVTALNVAACWPVMALARLVAPGPSSIGQKPVGL